MQSASARIGGSTVTNGWDTGLVTNLLNVDVKNISETLMSWHILLAGVIQITFAMIMLWHIIGLGAIFGITLLILGLLLSEYFSRALTVVYKAMVKITDERLSVISEMLHSIRIVKFFAWESYYREHVASLRQLELAKNWKRLFFVTTSSAVSSAGPAIIACICLGVRALLFGRGLTPSVAFTTVAILETLRRVVYRMPKVIVRAIQCRVSGRRISEFLALPDLVSPTTDGEDAPATKGSLNAAERIALIDAEFSW
ncbi:ABC transporter type 1, transmembrane domain-containing protein, partial [Thamnocephalis sphaerospora]